MKNKKGQQLMIGLLFLFMALAVTIAMIPAFNSILDIAQNSDSLNCPGFVDFAANQSGLPERSYNSTIGTRSTLGCLAIDLYLPYILLVVLIGGVTRLLYGRVAEPQQQYGY